MAKEIGWSLFWQTLISGRLVKALKTHALAMDTKLHTHYKNTHLPPKISKLKINMVTIKSSYLYRDHKFYPVQTQLLTTNEMFPDNSSNFSSFNFCNIYGFSFNSYSVEHHVSSKPHSLFLIDDNLYFVPFYFSILNFKPKLDDASMYSTKLLAFVPIILLLNFLPSTVAKI